MNQQELTIFNLGENLDNLMNLDPRDMVYAAFYILQLENIQKSL
ncbi:hypothetical protein DFH76_002508 [Clostridium beijerinckii]|nr:hypothetical protein [Clostridium beijerinckii]